VDLHVPAPSSATATRRVAPPPEAPPSSRVTSPTAPNAEPAAAPGAPRPRVRDSRAVRVALDLLPAFAVYAVVRVAGLVALSLLARSQGVDPWSRLTSFDGTWLLGIAGGGYDPLVPDPSASHHGLSNIAFFPLYPLLVAALSHLLGLTLTTTALTVTALAGLAAAGALYRLGHRLAGGRRAGLVLVVLWAAWPHSIVLSMTYTEALFVALAAWSTVALLERRWITAGVLCLLAGATRPFGAALAVAVAVAAAVAIVRALAGRRPREVVRPLAAAVLAPLGLLAYWGWLWSRTGRPDAWLYVQSAQWHSHFDGGKHTLQSLTKLTTKPAPLVLLVCMLIVLAAVVLTVALAVDGAPLPLVVYVVLVTTLVVGDGAYDNSKARFLLAAFPLLLLPARALAALRPATLAVLLGGLVAVSCWYNAYVLVIWHLSP
jgi:hypothetical protein